MPPIVSPLLRAIRDARGIEHCLICHGPVAAADDRMRLPGGGWVHRGCATYRMRRDDRVRRRLRR